MDSYASSYAAKLKNPLWQKKRLEILQRDNWTCADCSAGLNDGKTLHVHHKEYTFGKSPWEYPDENFEVLCEDCHANRHDPDKTEIEPLESTIEEEQLENESLTAAYHVLFADLKQEINRLFADDVDMDRQLTFVLFYENVQVESYLIWYSTNSSNNADAYKTVLSFNRHLGQKTETYESFCFRRYFGLRGWLIQRVVSGIVAENIKKIGGEPDVDEQMKLMRHHQKLNQLRIKFVPFYQRTRDNIFAKTDGWQVTENRA